MKPMLMRLAIPFLPLFFLHAPLNAQVNEAGMVAAFDDALTARFSMDAPGGAVLIARGNTVIYEKAIGLADLSTKQALTTDHQFRIASVTKQFAAVAILQLAEAGKLKVEDEIQKYVDFPEKEHPITIEHLLTHSSGIPDFTRTAAYTPEAYAKPITLPELIALFANEPLEFAPGTKWNYSNSGYLLLTAIIENVSGQTWSDYAREHLFEPAGMTSSSAAIAGGPLPNEAVGYAESEQGWESAYPISLSWPRAAGCIRSTVHDLWAWNRSVFAGKLVGTAMMTKAHRPFHLNDGHVTDYGYGWFLQHVQGSPTIEHNGGIDGFTSASLYLPNEDLYVAVLVNRQTSDASDLAPILAGIAMGKPYGGPVLPLNPEVAQDYTGVYVNAEGVERYITADDDGLHAQRQGSTVLDLDHLGNDRFIYHGDVITITFQRKDGRVAGARFVSRRGEEQLTRSDKPIPVRKEIPLNGTELQRYVGTFEMAEGFTLTFRVEGDRFFAQATRQPELELFGEGPHAFFLKALDARIEFYPEPDGSVKRVKLFQGGEMEGVRID
ncbi:MAG: serine hydrolase [Flavobacteriales bacterium]|nr:serine hydrolase [Flavobacteriales bacterium]